MGQGLVAIFWWVERPGTTGPAQAAGEHGPCYGAGTSPCPPRPRGVPCSCCPLTGRPALRQTATGPSRRPAAPADGPAGPAHAVPTHSRQAARVCDCAALNLAGLYGVVPYAHDPAWVSDSTFISKRGRKLPGAGWRWHRGDGQVAWGQQLEVLSVLDLDEHCSYPVHGCCSLRWGPGPR